MKSFLISVAVLGIAATVLTTSAMSQTGGSGQANPPAASGPGAGPGSGPGPRGHGWGRGMMMGPGMMGLAEWRMERWSRG
jgi:hypothetical protein